MKQFIKEKSDELYAQLKHIFENEENTKDESLYFQAMIETHINQTLNDVYNEGYNKGRREAGSPNN